MTVAQHEVITSNTTDTTTTTTTSTSSTNVVAKKKQKTKKITQNKTEQIEMQQQQNEQEQLSTKHIETHEKVIATQDEVVEDLQVAPKPTENRPIMPTHESSTMHITQSLNETTNFTPARTDTQQTANVTTYSQTAAVTEETITSESEIDRSFNLKNKEQVAKSSATKRIQESIEITQVDTTEQSNEIEREESPQQRRGEPNVVTQQSIQIVECLGEDNLTDLLSDTTLNSTTAKLDYHSIHDAKIVSEIVTAQREETLNESHRSVETLTIRTEHTEPVESIEITEIHRNEHEQEIAPKPKKSAKARYQLTESEPVQVTEVIAENTSDKYYPEIVVATETATTAIVAQKPYVSEVMHASEKEADFVPDKLPAEQLADVLLQTRETISVTEQNVQENEESFTGRMVAKSVNATDSFTTHESVTTQVADTQMPASKFEQPVLQRKQATVSVDERLTVSTGMVDVSESEHRLLTPDETRTTQANLNYSLLETSQSTQPFVNEREEELIASETKKTNARPVVAESDAVHTEESTPLDTIQPMRERKKSQTSAATLSYQLQDSTEITSIVSHEKEIEFKSRVMAEDAKATTLYGTMKSVQVVAQEVAEKETQLEQAIEVTQHKAKAVPAHALTSAMVEEIQLSSTTDDVKIDSLPLTTPKMSSNDLQETQITETVTYEGFTDFKPADRPEPLTATKLLTKRKSIQVVTHETNEREERLGSTERGVEQVANTVRGETSRSLIVEQVETSQTTEDVQSKMPATTTAKLVRSGVEETSVTEIIPFEGLSELKRNAKPEQMTATPSVSIHRSVQITQQELSEKEDEFKNIKSLESRIAPTMPTETLRSIIVEQVETSQTTIDRLEGVQNMTTAKVIRPELDETSVQETIPFEGVKELKPKEKPSEGMAVTSYDICKSVQVTEQETVEKEKSLAEEKLENEQVATKIPADTLKSVVVEEVELSQVASDVRCTEQPKSTAKLVNQELEPTSTTEVTSFEGLGDLKLSERPVEAMAQSSFDIRKSLQVTAQETVDKEEVLDFGKRVDGVKATKSPTDALKSVQVEEIQTSQFVSGVHTEPNQTSIARVVTSELEQKSVSEITSYENVADLKSNDRPIEETASPSYCIQKSVQVIEPILSEKEKPFDKTPTLTEHVATIMPKDTQRSVEVQQTETSMVSVDIESTAPKSTKAKEVQEQFDERTTLECVPFEALKPLKLLDQPEQSTANKQIDTMRSIQVTIPQVNEEETKFEVFDNDSQLGTPSVTHVLQSVVVEEVLPSQSIRDIIETTTPSTSAKLISTEEKEMQVSEQIIFEGVTQLEETEKYETKLAKTIIDEKKSISVRTSEISEREGKFEVKSNESQKASFVSTDQNQSITVEETEILSSTGELTKEQLPTETAKPISTELHETNVSEIVSYEKLEDISEMTKPVSKKGHSVHETQEALIVESSQIAETESEFIESKPSDHSAKLIPGHLLISAITQDVQPNETTASEGQFVRRMSKAQLTCTEVTSTMTQEITTFEDVNVINAAVTPEGKQATLELQEQTPLVVSTNQPDEKEVEFTERPDFITQSAHPFVDQVALKTAVVQETDSIPSISKLATVDHQTYNANIRQDEYEQTKTRETIVYETSETYDKSMHPESKKADQTYDLQTSVQVSTAELTEPDQPFNLTRPDNQQIKPGYSHTLKSAITHEVISTDSTDKIQNEATETVRSVSTADQFEQTTISEVTLFENVEQIITDKPAEKKQPQSTITTNLQNVLITETTINESESDLKDRECVSVTAAVPTILSHSVAESQETQYVDTIIPFNKPSVEERRATTDFEGLKAAEQIQSHPNESTGLLAAYRADDQTAILLQQASEALSVQQADTRESEQELDENLPEQLTVKQQTLPGLPVAEQSESILSMMTDDFVKPTAEKQRQATTIISELVTSVQEETRCEERIDELVDRPHVEQKKAKPSVNKLKAPVHAETHAEQTVKPMHSILVEEHAHETTSNTAKIIAETRETIINETTIDFSQQTSDTQRRRASQIFDSFKTSIVEEIQSVDTVTEMRDTQPIAGETLVERSEPKLPKNTVQVTEITTSELTTDDMFSKPMQDIAQQLVVEVEKQFYAKSEMQTVEQGR